MISSLKSVLAGLEDLNSDGGFSVSLFCFIVQEEFKPFNTVKMLFILLDVIYFILEPVKILLCI